MPESLLQSREAVCAYHLNGLIGALAAKYLAGFI